MSDDRKFWTPEEFEELKRLRSAGKMWAEVDEALGRNQGSSKSKWENEHSKDRVRSRAAENALKAPEPSCHHRSLTAAMMGDPPPGRSALDKRHAEGDIRSISLGGGAQ